MLAAFFVDVGTGGSIDSVNDFGIATFYLSGIKLLLPFSYQMKSDPSIAF